MGIHTADITAGIMATTTTTMGMLMGTPTRAVMETQTFARFRRFWLERDTTMEPLMAASDLQLVML